MTPFGVDVHTHCVPARVIDRLLCGEMVCPGLRLHREGDTVRVEIAHIQGPSAGTRRFRLVSTHCDLSARLPEMDRMGVHVQILSPPPYLYGHWLDPGAGERWCQLFNDSLAEAAGRHPDRFRYLAGLPMQDARLAARELARVHTTGGAVGVAVGTHIAEAYLDDPRFAPFWEAADGHSAWVLLHPAVEILGPSAMRSHYLANLVGHPMEIALAAARLMVAGVLLRYPRVRLCLAHGGGVLPLLVGRLERGRLVREEVRGLPCPVRDLYRRLYFDTVTHDPEALAYLVRAVGASHVCLGSDFPADMGDPDPLGTVREAPGLTDDDRARIARAAALMDAVPR